MRAIGYIILRFVLTVCGGVLFNLLLIVLALLGLKPRLMISDTCLHRLWQALGLR